VVVLSLVILAASCGVIWLLLESRREASRAPHRRYQNSTSIGSRGVEEGSLATTVPSSPPGFLRSTVDRFLKRHEKKNSGPTDGRTSTRRGGWSWVRAPNGEDTSTASAAPQMSEVLDIRRLSPAPQSREPSPTSQTHRQDPSRSRASSTLSFTSTASNQRASIVAYHEPYAPKPQRSLSANNSLHSEPFASSVALGTPTSSPRTKNSPISSSPEHTDENTDRGHVYPSLVRPFAVRSQSGASLRTVDVGSKFFEEL